MASGLSLNGHSSPESHGEWPTVQCIGTSPFLSLSLSLSSGVTVKKNDSRSRGKEGKGTGADSGLVRIEVARGRRRSVCCSCFSSRAIVIVSLENGRVSEVDFQWRDGGGKPLKQEGRGGREAEGHAPHLSLSRTNSF